jgi:bacterial/archaeal transporter family protein
MGWIGWALLSALFAAVTAVTAKIGVDRVDANLATAVRTSVVLVFSWLIALLARRPDAQPFTPKTWIFLIVSGLATGLSWVCYFHAMRLGEASRVAPVDKLGVALTIVLAAIFLGEPLTVSGPPPSPRKSPGAS